MRVLLNLISGQTMPVYIADQITNPEILTCLFTKQSETEYNNIVNSISKKIDEIEIPAFDFNKIKISLEEYISKYLSKDDELIFNFTGGTKIQSIALFQYAMENNYEAIYINAESEEYIRFKNNNAVERKKYEVKIKPNTYLSLSGHKLDFSKTNVTKNGQKYLDLMEKYSKLFNPLITKGKINSRILGSYFKVSIESIKVKLQVDGEVKLSFDSKLFDDFVVLGKGYWLEHLSAQKLKSINQFDYVYSNLLIPRVNIANEGSYKNEIDILAMHGTTPYIFECKNKRIEKADIDKLNYLKRTYFGRYCKLFFIGTFPPSSTIQEALSDYQIRFINFYQLSNFLNSFDFSSNPNLK